MLLSLEVFFHRRHPDFWDVNSIFFIVVRVRSYMNCLFYTGCVEMEITVNKLYFALEVLWACSETVGIRVVAGRISQSWSLILSCIDLPVSPMLTFPQGIL